MSVFKDYARLVLFTAGILVGVQIPSFIDQYAKRISAHHLEAKANFQGYETTATKHFDGDVKSLLRHYGASSDPVFKDDAETIKRIYHRIQMFSNELRILDASLLKRIVHVAFDADKVVLEETFSEYSYTVPLTHEAILCGLGLGLAASLVFDLLLFGLIRTGGFVWRRHKVAHE
jgi:DUF2937 family protein